ncbi:hypothetical protein [Chryseobacterium sp. 5_R23647]|uniref:hypothetical protein n=1 Tax=Chryseobacterium sp. 5_R23647 TaxID=2258964 RepID=UPI000F514461|nr:hypothetical protein [Chryseobacterium sp. 5_R23647]
MKRADFLELIINSEQPYHNEFSYKNGSDYFSINGHSIRISDHSKPQGTFGSETYKEGENDFRTYEEALSYLSQFLDMSDKTKQRACFYSENEAKLIRTNEGDFKNPFGTFASVESALNNWYRTTRKLTK